MQKTRTTVRVFYIRFCKKAAGSKRTGGFNHYRVSICAFTASSQKRIA